MRRLVLSLNVFFYDAPEHLEQSVTTLFDSLTFRLESCAGAPGPRAPSRRAYAMSSSKRADDELEDEIKSRQQRLREQHVALDERQARLDALEADLDKVAELRRLDEEEEVAEVRRAKEEEPDPERTRSEAVAAGNQPRLSAADNARSTEVPRLQYVARDLLRAHGKDAVIMIINRLREAFAPNITLAELQDFGGEDLVNTLVQIAAENGVEPAELQDISARVTRSCEE